MGWVWIASVAVAAGQEPQLPKRLPAAGEVVVSVSIRVTDGRPRFVVAGRVVEEAVEAGGAEKVAASYLSVPRESPPEIVEYFKANARQHIADIERVCGLTEQQQAKLELAAMGDMSQLVRESRQVREKHAGMPLRNQHHNLAAFEDVATVNTHLSQGVLRNDSMFLRVLKSLLTPTQMSQLAEAKFVELTTDWTIELTDEQQLQLWRLVLRHNAPKPPPLLWSTKHCRAVVAELPRQELVSLLGESKVDILRGWYPR